MEEGAKHLGEFSRITVSNNDINFKPLNLFILQMHTATKKPQGDTHGWRTDKKHLHFLHDLKVI